MTTFPGTVFASTRCSAVLTGGPNDFVDRRSGLPGERLSDHSDEDWTTEVLTSTHCESKPSFFIESLDFCYRIEPE
jgi:hypothetical protein